MESGYRVNETFPELKPFIEQVQQNIIGRTPCTPAFPALVYSLQAIRIARSRLKPEHQR